MMKIQWKKLIVSLVIPLAVGGLSALLTREGMERFSEVQKPPLAPPAWLFPVAWTILYVLMGVAAYLIWVAPHPFTLQFAAYGTQLFFNFFWSLIFFNLKNDLFAFVWLVFLWLFILLTVLLFRRNDRTAAWLMVPYLVWVTFAGYLNLGIYLLNR